MPRRKNEEKSTVQQLSSLAKELQKAQELLQENEDLKLKRAGHKIKESLIWINKFLDEAWEAEKNSTVEEAKGEDSLI